MKFDGVSFPGLGIDEFKINPVAISITDNINIKWYAVFICIGMVIAYFVCNNLRKKYRIKEDDFLDCIIYTIPIAFIGARIVYILGDLKSFHSFKDMIAIWDGGIAIYGGIIFATLSVFIICKLKKCDPFLMLDIMAIGFMIGQMIGRWGNFFNIEVYGVETTLPWRMGIGYYGTGAEIFVHPLFFYEILWNLVGFILIFGYKNYKKFNGEVFVWYTAWYGLGRGLLEQLRDPKYNLGNNNVRIMVVVAFALCIVAVLVDVIIRLKFKNLPCTVAQSTLKAKSENDNYEKQFKIDLSENDSVENTDIDEIIETENENESEN